MVTTRRIKKKKICDKSEARAFYRRRRATPKSIVLINVIAVEAQERKEIRDVRRKSQPGENRGLKKRKRGKRGGKKKEQLLSAKMTASRRYRSRVRCALNLRRKKAEAIRLKTLAAEEEARRLQEASPTTCLECGRVWNPNTRNMIHASGSYCPVLHIPAPRIKRAKRRGRFT